MFTNTGMHIYVHSLDFSLSRALSCTHAPSPSLSLSLSLSLPLSLSLSLSHPFPLMMFYTVVSTKIYSQRPTSRSFRAEKKRKKKEVQLLCMCNEASTWSPRYTPMVYGRDRWRNFRSGRLDCILLLSARGVSPGSRNEMVISPFGSLVLSSCPPLWKGTNVKLSHY